MIADLAALAYLVSGVLFILALRGLSSPETSRRGKRHGNDRYGPGGGGDAVPGGCSRSPHLGHDHRRGRHRRHYRRHHRPAHTHDRHAAAGGGIPQPGGHGGGAGGSFGAVHAGGLRHRHRRQHQGVESRRDGPGRGHRRRHLHGFRGGFHQAAGIGVRRARGVSRAASVERAAGNHSRRAHRVAVRHRIPHGLLGAGHPRVRHRRADSSSPSAAPTCRW